MKQKILSLLVLLLTAATGAWAQEETLLVTMTAGETVTYDPATATDVAEITMTGATQLGTWEDYYYGNHYSWLNSSWNDTDKGTLEVTAKPGYTITKVVFSGSDIVGSPGSREVTASPFAVYPWGWSSAFGSAVYTSDSYTEIIKNTASNDILGIDKIEVYGYAGTPAPGIKVTTNAASEGATFTEASFTMPSSDVTVSYELVRDMAVEMPVSVGDGTDGFRIRLKKDGQAYVPADMTIEEMLALIKIHDGIEDQDLVFYGDGKNCDVNIFAVDDQDKPTGDAIIYANLTPGRYVALASAAEGTIYDGTTEASNVFVLYEGYEVEVPASGYATFYCGEAVRLDDQETDAQLYTICSVTDTEAELSYAFDASPANIPLLVYNNGGETRNVILIPCNEPDLALTVADEFKGTLAAKTITADDMAVNNYFTLGSDLSFVLKDGSTISANSCWLEIPASAPTTARKIVANGSTGIGTTIQKSIKSGDWYDLSGRKLYKKPAKKGVYIQNAQKVVVD